MYAYLFVIYLDLISEVSIKIRCKWKFKAFDKNNRLQDLSLFWCLGDTVFPQDSDIA